MAKIVGANEQEVAVMGTLTGNLHQLLISFYTPTKTRYKILIESKAFPSDHFAVESQLDLHGYNVESGLITVEPDEGSSIISTTSILQMIEREGDEIACVMLSGVHYYSGQLFDMERITSAAHAKVRTR
jgi:kynureninase